MRKFLLGLGALATIVVILVGVPLILVVVAHDPLPTAGQIHNIMTLVPDYGNLILLTKVLPCVAWIAWAFFAVPLLIEIGAGIAGTTTTKRVWAFKGQQYAAAALVTAVLIMFASLAGSHSPASPASSAAHAPSISIVSAELASAPTSPAVHTVLAVADANPQTTTVVHIVVPGDNLWDISESYYGVGTRDMDIFRASTGILQPGGQRLTNPNLIRPGWELTVPDVPVPASDAPSVSSHSVPNTNADPSPADSTPQSAQNLPTGSATAGNLSPSTPTAPASSHPSERTDKDNSPGLELAIPITTTGGIVGLLAAGLLVALARRRLYQRRRRRPGERIAMPEPAGADLEQELRMVADPLGLADIDNALRLLQTWAEDTGTTLPELLAVRLAEDEITFYLTAPADLPTPFLPVTGERTVWRIEGGGVPLPPRPVLSPYPALVIVGVDDNAGVLLLDLERLGILNILGDPASALGVLNAIVAELAGNPWGEQLQVTMVGMPAALPTAIDPFRVHHAGDIGAVLPGWKVDLAERETALGSYQVDDVHSGRVVAAVTESWAPHILLVADTSDDLLRRELAETAAAGRRLGFAVVAADELDPNCATIRLLSSRRAELILPDGAMPPLPFSPQILEGPDLTLLQGLFDTTDRPSEPPTTREADATAPDRTGITGRLDVDSPPDPPSGAAMDQRPPVAEAEAGEITPTLPVLSEPSVPPLPYVRILGPVEAEGLDPSAPMPGRGIELVAYLLLREGPVDGLQLQRAFWPDTPGAANNQRGLAKQVRVALGRGPSGEPFLPENANHRGYVLHPAIRSDWDDFQALIGEDPTLASSDHLVAALRLVRGTPFAGSNTRRWWQWIAIPQEKMIAAIMDAANELGTRALTSRNASLVRFAAHIQQAVDPLNEAGWRIELKAALQAGAIDTFNVVLEDLYARVGGNDPDYDVDDDTRALIERANQRIRA